MNVTTKIAALSPVALGLLGLTQAHWVVSHVGTLAEVGAAVTVGAAVWAGKRITGRRKAAEQDEAGTADQAAAYLAGIRAAAQLPSSQPTWPSQTVQGHITREV